MGRFARSWDLLKTSMRVIMQDKELLWMPILSAIASLVTVSAIAGAAWVAGIWPETQTADGSANVPGILVAFLLYILLAFVTLFFNAAVVAGASERLGGGDPTVGSKAGRLFLWAIVVATVNVILQAIRERAGVLGRMLSTVGGLAWNLATFFMIPVLLFEGQSIGGSVKRSGGLFKQTWGETVIGQGGLGLAGMALTFLVVLVGVMLVVLLGSLGPVGLVTGIVLLVLGIVLLAAFLSVLEGVYKAALYRYATKGQAVGFSPEQLGAAFAPK
jgi:hypothetical protein